MAAKHVYWRDKVGNPSKEDKCAPTSILAEIGKTARINEEGQPQWQGFGLYRYQTALRSKLVICDATGEELNGHDSWGIARRAIAATIKRDGGEVPIRLGHFVSKANELARKHFAQPLTEYHLISSMSVATFPFRWTTSNGCRLYAGPNRRRYPVPPAISGIPASSPHGQHLKRTRYGLIRASVSGRTIHEASDAALTAISRLRGLWNLFATYRSWSIGSGFSRRQPLGVIHGGPIHTLHYPDGSSPEDLYWYEPNFTGDHRLFSTDPKRWESMERYRKWATTRIRALPYGTDLARLLDRYVEALDSPNLDVAFLHMWGLLEKITGTVGARYDDTVSRAVRPIVDREVAIEMIEAVRSRRNQYVHSARSSDDSDQVAYLVKNFVDLHLLELLRNGFGVTTLDDYGEVLSLPASGDALLKRRDELARRLNWAEQMIRFDST